MNKIHKERIKVAIWWVKKDFRLNDNAALFNALESNSIVIPMYLFEPLLMNGPDWGSFHTEAISDGAMSLSKNLTHFNSKLLTFGSSPIDAVEQIRQRVNLSGFEVKEVFSHE
ncbi:deoxyribodipyrimidine photo-lyase [Pseudoalteromonas translucida]|nr:deoxyribodipyrimidine photo-lyase [Pseudoalteromonas translucida]